MTKEELLSTHPGYDANLGEWEFFVRSYFGGKPYRDGDYLLQHPFESSANYARRKSIAYYYNYCGPIVDIMVSHLFRKPPKRDFASFLEDPLFAAFLSDADLEGASFNQFMRDAARFASVYGRVSIVVDMPGTEVSTVAEATTLGVHPYLSLVTPENLLDWSFERDDAGRPVLSMAKIREGSSFVKIWTRDGWELWSVLKDDVVLVDAASNCLGVVPLVNFYNKRSGMKMLGVSDIQDIADINKNIYYLCSDAKEIIENTAFPMLAVPYEKGSVSGEKPVGPRNILQFDPSEPNSRPYWLEAPHSSLTEIREWVRQDINEIHRIAKMGGVKATEDFSAARSAAALELEYQQLHSVLSEKADNLEQAETSVLELWGAWIGKTFDGVIDYPDDFSVRELDRDLDRAIKALTSGIKYPSFVREVHKSMVNAVLPKAADSVKASILGEIDSFDSNHVCECVNEDSSRDGSKEE